APPSVVRKQPRNGYARDPPYCSSQQMCIALVFSGSHHESLLTGLRLLLRCCQAVFIGSVNDGAPLPHCGLTSNATANYRGANGQHNNNDPGPRPPSLFASNVWHE